MSGEPPRSSEALQLCARGGFPPALWNQVSVPAFGLKLVVVQLLQCSLGSRTLYPVKEVGVGVGIGIAAVFV